MSTSSTQPNSEITLTYKYLLTFSTLSAVFFCWLYVTKPTVIAPPQPNGEARARAEDESPELKETNPVPTQQSFADLHTSGLPGDNTAPQPQDNTGQVQPNIPLAVSHSTQGSIGYEETNDRVQHVITAQSNTASERIILEVPVIYQTRGLRFGPEQANEAQRVLRALKIYQSQINKLHQDGKNIQMAWDNILMNAQPVEALRADSPSLPQKSSSHPSMLSENSASTIKLSK